MYKHYVYGGGTFTHVRAHLALAAPAFGGTAKALAENLQNRLHGEVHLRLTKMADSSSGVVTNEDVERDLEVILRDPNTKVIVMSAALCDYNGHIGTETSGKYATRLRSRDGAQQMTLVPTRKILRKIRKERKDIFLVGFKTTSGASEEEQYLAGLNLLKEASCNLVLANDLVTRTNMVITPEMARYYVTTDRSKALDGLARMIQMRHDLSFTRTTVVGNNLDLIPMDSPTVPRTFSEVVQYCVDNGAYVPFRGVTVGHFAYREVEGTLLSSRRKTNYTAVGGTDLVRVEIGNENSIAHGAKPSAGTRSQWMILSDPRWKDRYDCIVHFHCPLKEGHRDVIQVQSQYPFECGSHECGKNTLEGIRDMGDGVAAVMLDKHGPNILFHHSVDPQRVIEFINVNFDLRSRTT